MSHNLFPGIMPPPEEEPKRVLITRPDGSFEMPLCLWEDRVVPPKVRIEILTMRGVGKFASEDNHMLTSKPAAGGKNVHTLSFPGTTKLKDGTYLVLFREVGKNGRVIFRAHFTIPALDREASHFLSLDGNATPGDLDRY